MRLPFLWSGIIWWFSQLEGMVSLFQMELDSEISHQMKLAPASAIQLIPHQLQELCHLVAGQCMASSISPSVMGWVRSSSSGNCSWYDGVITVMSGSAPAFNWLTAVLQLDTSAKCSTQRRSLSVSLESMILSLSRRLHDDGLEA